MRVTVTGASGHIGGNLVRALLARGEEVRAVVFRGRRALEGLDVECVQADVRDAAAIAKAVSGSELVFHLAGHIDIVGDRQKVAEVNVGGTRNIVAACHAEGVRRLVHFSSIHAYTANPRDEVVDETRALTRSRADPPYDRSKAAAQRLVTRAAADGLDAVIVNPTGVIGPHDYGPSNVGRLLIDLQRRSQKVLVGGGFNWVDVRDVVDAAIAAADRGRAGEAYILAGQWLSVTELAEVASTVTGVATPRLAIPNAVARAAMPLIELWAAARPGPRRFTRLSLRALRDHRHVSSAKATRELGFSARPLAATIADTYAFFAEQGMLRL